MEKGQTFQRNAGFLAFFLNDICITSNDVVASIPQGVYGFAYDITGTLLSLVNIGNLLVGFTSGMLSAKIDTRKTVVLLTAGYEAGYVIMGFPGWMPVLMLGFSIVGVAKESIISTYTILVADNSGDRTKGMNIMHGCYVLGALLCPFFIAATMKAGSTIPTLVLAARGFLLWLTFYVTPAEAKVMKRDWNIDESFLKSKEFQTLAGLPFCQNVVETSVTGWMVTYFKGNGITSGSFSPYTVAMMWGATLIARSLIAFVISIENSYPAMIKIGIGYIILHMGLMVASIQITAILLLFAFTLATAGISPTAVADVSRIISAASMEIILPAASSGAIIIPWIIGIVSEYAGIEIGMVPSIIPCAGMLLFSAAVKQLKEQEL